MTKFAYNNIKNANTGYIFFEFNCKYHFCISYEKNFDLYSKLKSVKKLSSKLSKLIIISQQNFYHTKKIQKQAYNKGVKLQNYASGNKVWLNSRHLKIK